MSQLPSPPLDLPTADPTALDRLVESLAGIPLIAGLPGAADVFTALRRTVLRYAVQRLPCPNLFGLNSTPPTPGQGFDFFFSNASLPFYYSVTVIRLDPVNGDRVVYQESKLFNPGDTLKFTIPNKIPGTNNDMFEDGVSYQFILQPTLKFGTVEVAYGCVQSQSIAVSATEAFRFFSAALALWPPKDG